MGGQRQNAFVSGSPARVSGGVYESWTANTRDSQSKQFSCAQAPGHVFPQSAPRKRARDTHARHRDPTILAGLAKELCVFNGIQTGRKAGGWYFGGARGE